MASRATLGSLGRRRPRECATRIRVRGAFAPNIVYARVGEPLRLVFRREETAACSERVVFPAFGVSAMLPPFESVLVELLPDRPGEFEFTCQMGIPRGRIVVEGEA